MAGPTVKNSAYNSKPSKSQPRLAASRIFHWWRLSARYHGCAVARVSVMSVPLVAAPPNSPDEFAIAENIDKCPGLLEGLSGTFRFVGEVFRLHKQPYFGEFGSRSIVSP